MCLCVCLCLCLCFFVSLCLCRSLCVAAAQWASSIRHEPVRVLMHYGLQQCPVESYPLSGTKNTFTCYRKWTDGGNVAPLLAEDVERAKPEPTAADDLQWCVGGLDDDDEDDDAEEQDAAEPKSGGHNPIPGDVSHPAKRRRDDAARGTTHKRRKHTSHDTATCALCARPERKKNEVTSSAKWEGRLFEFSGRRFHEQCLLWSSGLDVSEDTATSLVVVDPSPLLLACCPRTCLTPLPGARSNPVTNGREVDRTSLTRTYRICSSRAATACARDARNLAHPSAATSAAASACSTFSARGGFAVLSTPR